MSDFIVRFEGVELSKQHAHTLQAAIQRTVLAEFSALAASTPNPDGPDGPDGPSILTMFPVKWRGIYVMPRDVLRKTPEVLDKQLSVNAK